jgi:APA family basic amino acid/polyamine antiporter
MTSPTSAGLRRILGVGFGLAVTVGGTIGVGILRTPSLIAAQLPDPFSILLVWVIGGLYTLLGAVCLAELGTAVPQAGGYYVYARRALGDAVGFAVGWTDWLTYCAVLAYLSIAIGEFLVVLVPSLAGFDKAIAIVTLVGFVGLQWAGLRVSSWFQEWTTAVKCLAFLALVVACLAMAGGTLPAAAPSTAALPPATMTGVIVALQAVVIAFGGWQGALYFAEEDRNPQANLPRAMIGGVLAVIVIYVLVNAAVLAVLPIPDLARSMLAAADAARVVFGDRGGQFITVLSILSLVPLLNAIMMIGTRILFALGRDGLFWSRAATVNAGGTPAVATLVTTILAIGLIATGTFQQLVALVSCFLAANYCICCIALIVLRKREPSLARPFRAWGYPWSAAIVVIGAVIFLIGVLIGDTVNGLIAIGLLGAGLAERAVTSGLSRKGH